MLEELVSGRGIRNVKNRTLQGLEISGRTSGTQAVSNQRKIEAFRNQRRLSPLNLAQNLNNEGLDQRRLRIKSYHQGDNIEDDVGNSDAQLRRNRS